MLSRLQELKKEEETLLKIKLMLQDQLNRLKVTIRALLESSKGMSYLFVLIELTDVAPVPQFEEGTLKSMIRAQSEETPNEAPEPEVYKHILSWKGHETLKLPTGCISLTHFVHTKEK